MEFGRERRELHKRSVSFGLNPKNTNHTHMCRAYVPAFPNCRDKLAADKHRHHKFNRFTSTLFVVLCPHFKRIAESAAPDDEQPWCAPCFVSLASRTEAKSSPMAGCSNGASGRH